MLASLTQFMRFLVLSQGEQKHIWVISGVRRKSKSYWLLEVWWYFSTHMCLMSTLTVDKIGGNYYRVCKIWHRGSLTILRTDESWWSRKFVDIQLSPRDDLQLAWWCFFKLLDIFTKMTFSFMLKKDNLKLKQKLNWFGIL